MSRSDEEEARTHEFSTGCVLLAVAVLACSSQISLHLDHRCESSTGSFSVSVQSKEGTSSPGKAVPKTDKADKKRQL